VKLSLTVGLEIVLKYQVILMYLLRQSQAFAMGYKTRHIGSGYRKRGPVSPAGRRSRQRTKDVCSIAQEISPAR
jgi:hypothetical protein